MAEKIPIWVSGQQKWVKGVNDTTSCNDIIFALTGNPEGDYVIIEKWKDVEKPLNGLVKVWQVWKEWGDAQDEVKLTLRKVLDSDSGRESSCSFRKKRHHKGKCFGQSIHPKKLSQLSKTQNIERLLKLILVQGETIQSQIRKLREREVQIELIEEEKHKERVSALGSNYVIETYLGRSNEDEKENDSGVVTETHSSENQTPPFGNEAEGLAPLEEDSEIKELKNQIQFWEKIVRLNKKLEKKEETLVRLYISLRQMTEKDEAKVLGDLRRVSIECSRCEQELEANNFRLLNVETVIREKRKKLQRLHSELEASEMETFRLTEVRKSLCQNQLLVANLDSNSDTGLSSLHSSSEEGACTFDAVL